MKIYCFCQVAAVTAKKDALLGDQVLGAPNRLGPEIEGDRPVFLQIPMRVAKVGVEQRVMPTRVPVQKWLDAEGQVEEDQMLRCHSTTHYPSVDVLQCPHCGALVACEV